MAKTSASPSPASSSRQEKKLKKDYKLPRAWLEELAGDAEVFARLGARGRVRALEARLRR